MTGRSNVSELVCQRVVLSASWFVSEMSVKRYVQADKAGVPCYKVYVTLTITIRKRYTLHTALFVRAIPATF